MPAEREIQTKSYALAALEGGMNTAVAPDRIAENEAQLIQNFEYDKGQLRMRGGYGKKIVSVDGYDSVASMYYDGRTGMSLLFGKSGDVFTTYLAEGTIPTNIGKVTGTAVHPCCCTFGDYIMIASGGKLQYYDYGTKKLATVSSSYECDNCFLRDGRLVTSKQGDDNLRYSSIGDCTSDEAWTEDTNIESQAQWFEIGYKDNGDIITCLPLSGDIMVFKSSDTIYDVSGQCPDITISLTAVQTHAENYRPSIINMGSTIAFVTDMGIRTLEAVQLYGNFEVGEAGYKINKSITKNGLLHPQTWNLLSKRQLWIRPNIGDKKTYYIYQYDMQIGYKFTFADDIEDIAETDSGVVLAIGGGLYLMNYDYADDNRTPIDGVIKSKLFTTPHKIITRGLDVYIDAGEHEGTMQFRIGTRVKTIDVQSKRRIYPFYNNTRGFEVELRTSVPMKFNHIDLYAVEV